MTRHTFAALALLAAPGIAYAQETKKVGGQEKALIATGREEAWISLFDGKTLAGWQINDFSGGSKWEVVDGELRGSGTASMITSEQGGFKNFRVRAELKVSEGGNSGFYFRTTAKPGFTDGYESQVNASHADPIRTGSIYTWIHLFEATHEADEWYTHEIECRDINFRGSVATSIVVKVDGKVLFQLIDHTRQFKQGHIAFQQHDPGSKVSIRKIEIMHLPDETPGQ